MTTPKALLNQALKAPMSETGWTPKAAGWFVRPLTPDHLAVVATSVATQHALPDEGQATAHLGLRVEAVEETLARLLGVKDEGYRSRTATTPLGYASSQNRWREWPLREAEVGRVASDMVALINDEGLSHLLGLAQDADSLLAAVKASASFGQSVGFARLVVLLAHLDRREEARQAIEECRHQVEGRFDAAAQEARQAADALVGWLGENSR